MGEHIQGLIGVGSDDDMLEVARLALIEQQPDTSRLALDLPHRGLQVDLAVEIASDGFDIHSAPTGDGAPGMVPGDTEQTVVLHELEEGFGWELMDITGAG